MARGAIPGLPTHFKIVYMQQELSSVADESLTLEKFIQQELNASNISRLSALRTEEQELEEAVEQCASNGSDSSEELSRLSERLCVIAEDIENLEKSQDDNSLQVRIELLQHSFDNIDET